MYDLYLYVECTKSEKHYNGVLGKLDENENACNDLRYQTRQAGKYTLGELRTDEQTQRPERFHKQYKWKMVL